MHDTVLVHKIFLVNKENLLDIASQCRSNLVQSPVCEVYHNSAVP